MLPQVCELIPDVLLPLWMMVYLSMWALASFSHVLPAPFTRRALRLCARGPPSLLCRSSSPHHPGAPPPRPPPPPLPLSPRVPTRPWMSSSRRRTASCARAPCMPAWGLFPRVGPSIARSKVSDVSSRRKVVGLDRVAFPLRFHNPHKNLSPTSEQNASHT